MAWFFNSAGGLVFFEHWPSFFLTFAGTQVTVLEDSLLGDLDSIMEKSSSSQFCNGHDVLNADDCIRSSQLQSIILDKSSCKSWLHCEQEIYWRRRLEACSSQPTMVVVEDAEEYACPIHKQLYREQYFASHSDCEKCQFNLGSSSDCRCAADTGITCISDFDVSEALRQYRVEQLRQENEQAIITRKQAEELAKQTQKLAEQAKLQEAEQRRMGFYLNKTCPKCGKKLTKKLGMKGVYWLCFGSQCDFHAFENKETGELITHGMD